TSLAGMVSLSRVDVCSGGLPARAGRLLDHAHDVRLLHDHQLLTIELDLSSRPLAEEDAVTRLDIERVDLAVLATRAGADGDDLALHRLLLGGVGDDDAAGALLFLFDAPDEHTVMQRAKWHCSSPIMSFCDNELAWF